jgi:hypothetical protein
MQIIILWEFTVISVQAAELWLDSPNRELFVTGWVSVQVPFVSESKCKCFEKQP